MTKKPSPVEVAKDFNIDWGFIRELEGFSLKGYVPNQRGKVIGASGVTIGCGFDLGQHDADDLEQMGISETLISKFQPYLLVKRQEALNLIHNRPLSITPKQFEEMDKKLKTHFLSKLETVFPVGYFKSLGKAEQTVVASLAFQYGLGFKTRCPRFYKLCLSGKWQDVYEELKNFGDAYASRRNKEAEYLKENFIKEGK